MCVFGEWPNFRPGGSLVVISWGLRGPAVVIRPRLVSSSLVRVPLARVRACPRPAESDTAPGRAGVNLIPEPGKHSIACFPVWDVCPPDGVQDFELLVADGLCAHEGLRGWLVLQAGSVDGAGCWLIGVLAVVRGFGGQSRMVPQVGRRCQWARAAKALMRQAGWRRSSGCHF